MCWVGISVWLRAGSSAPGTVPGRGWPQCSQSRDPVRTLVSGSEMRPRQPLVVLPASFPQCMRAERPPSPAQRWDCRWAAVQENRFGGGSPVGGGWGPKQPTCLNWPGPPGQQVARARALPGEQTWPGWGAPSASAPSPPPPSWEPLQYGSPIPAPRTLSIPPSQASGTLIDPVLPPGFSALTSLAAPAPLLAPTPRLSPICPGVRPAHLPALVPLPPHCLPRFAPRLAAGPASLLTSPLCLPISTPQPAAFGPKAARALCGTGLAHDPSLNLGREELSTQTAWAGGSLLEGAANPECSPASSQAPQPLPPAEGDERGTPPDICPGPPLPSGHYTEGRTNRGTGCVYSGQAGAPPRGSAHRWLPDPSISPQAPDFTGATEGRERSCYM